MTSQKMIAIWAKVLSENPMAAKKLVEVLERKNKERFLPAIFKKAAKIYSDEKRIELILARPHALTLANRIRKNIQERFGKDKEIVEKIDPALVGGYRIKTDDLLIKASIKDFLIQIKNGTLRTI